MAMPTDDDDLEEVETGHSLPESAEDIRLTAGLATSSSWVDKLLTKRNLIIAGVSFVVLLVIVSIAAAAGGSSSQNAPESDRMKQVVDFLSQASSYTSFDDRNSPQYVAADWIANQDGHQVVIPKTLEDDDIPMFLQRYALAVLFFALKGDEWNLDVKFLSEEDECEWFYLLNKEDGDFQLGVTCNSHHHVSELKLPGNNLQGRVPAEIGFLTNLRHLTLFSNDIRGQLPEEMASLTKLRFMTLGSNAITGSIPSWFGQLTKLEHLEMGDNKLTGFIPESMTRMTKLEDLALDTNNLVGEADVLNDMDSLRRVYLSENFLAGRLDSLFVDSNLKELDLSDNNFAGTLPKHLFEGNLKVLDLSRNELTGSLPVFPDENDAMQYLSLHTNQLNGKIEEDIWNMAGLRHLDLSDNQFSSWLPSYAIAWMYNLTYLFVANNPFEGEVIGKFYDMVNLRELSLKNTNRTGPIPDWIGHNLTDLVLLDLGGNALTGTIPKNLGDLKNLSFLLLNNNSLTGTVPTSFAKLENLEMVLLHDNQLTGDIEHMCGREDTTIEVFSSQCGGPDPPIDCSCCTKCCEDGQPDVCVKGDLLATYDLSYESYYERDEFVFSEDLVFHVKTPSD